MKSIFYSKLVILVALFSGLCMSAFAQPATFSYTGSVQSYTVPAGATQLAVDAMGAAGGAAYNCCSSDPNALGGRVQCNLAVTAGTVLYIYVGGKGSDWTNIIHSSGGYNGGGGGGSYAADGGGASDIRTSASGGAFTGRLVVAGGAGGGGDFDAAAGAGGGLTGGTGAGGACGGGQTGPACSVGYVLGTLGNGGTGNIYSIGGGGGGWWGGNAGQNGDGAGGGGSSYTDPVLATSVIHTQGYAGASGNGVVILTPNCMAPGYITGNVPLCPGDTNIVSNPTGDPSGVWVSSNPAIATIDSFTGVLVGVASGLDTITFVLSNPCGGSSAQAMTVVTVNPVPGPVTGTNSVCLGSVTALSDSGVGTWSSSNMSIATVGTSGMVMGLSAGVDTISYSLLTGCGYAYYSVTVNPLPSVYSISGGGSYCAGGSGVHVGLSSSDAGISYQLYTSGAVSGAAVAGSGSSLDFGFRTSAGSYSVFATNTSTSCTNNMADSAYILITPVVIPTASIVSSMGDTLCNGITSTFTAVYTHGGPTPTFSWTKNGANVGTDSIHYTYTPSNGDVIALKVTSDTVCAIPDSAVTTKIMSVLPNGTPSLSIVSVPGSDVCSGTMVTVNATPVYGGYTPSYTWVLNTINVSTASSYHYIPSAGDNIYCILSSDYRCKLATTAYSNVINMRIDTPVVPYVTVVAHPGLYITAGQPDTLVATVYNAGTSPAYQWYINNSPVPAATTNTFIRSTFANKDSVSCMVTRNDICGLSSINSVVFKVHPVGVQQINFSGSEITLVPNPNNGDFTISGSLGTTDEAVFMEVTNMLGQVVYTKNATAANGLLNEQIQINNNVADGIYILTLHAASGTGTIRFVIER